LQKERKKGYGAPKIGARTVTPATMNEQVFIGLSGIELPVPKYEFPAEYQNATRLAYYATFFNSIEINSTFYKLPMASTIARWSSSVPDSFRFTFKLLRDVTHSKDLRFDEAQVARFFETISFIGKKKGTVLVQFPPSLRQESFVQLEQLLNAIQKHNVENVWPVAVEFRHKGWYSEEVYDLLQSHGASLVIQDIPKSASPLNAILSDTLYVRFHGPTGNYRGSYADALLSEYAGYVREWLADQKKVFVYFNNTAGSAFANARTFVELLQNDLP
jgi:uncharacterized protein YecE (DUF72 family)